MDHLTRPAPDSVAPEKVSICDRVSRDARVSAPSTSQEYALERLRGVSSNTAIREEGHKESMRWSQPRRLPNIVAFFIGVLFALGMAGLKPFIGRGLMPWIMTIIVSALSITAAFFVIRQTDYPFWFMAFLALLFIVLFGIIQSILLFIWTECVRITRMFIDIGNHSVE